MTTGEIQFARASMAMEILTAEEDGDKGTIEAIVSAYNVKYRMGFLTHHTIKPGAFAASLADNSTVPLFWMHAWDWTEQPPIGHAEASEVEKPKPGLKIAGEMYLDQPGVAPVFRAMKAGAIREWSIGYAIRAMQVDDEDEFHQIITESELLEASSVLRGANPETETLKVAKLHPATVRRVAESLGVDPAKLAALVAGAEDEFGRSDVAKPGDGEPPEGKAKADNETSTTPVEVAGSGTGSSTIETGGAEDGAVIVYDDLADAAREIAAKRLERKNAVTSRR